jgi:hypothetical protein
VYRQSARAPATPTRVEYRSYEIRYRACLLALTLFALAVVVLSSVHATHLTCSRDATPPTCTLASYGVFVAERPRDVPLSEIRGMKVELYHGSKGGTYARAWLTTRTSGLVDVSGGALLATFDPADARAASASLDAFLAEPARPTLDVWISSGKIVSVFYVVFGGFLMVFSVAVAREQIVQLFPIRVVVDHARQAVALPRLRREVAVSSIEDVVLEDGDALRFSSGKNKRTPGWRLVVVLRDGTRVPLTKDFRAGSKLAHEHARRRILAALGKATNT